MGIGSLNVDWSADVINESPAPALNDIDNDNLKSQIAERYKQDTTHRKYFAYWVIVIDSAWLVYVAITLLLQGCSCISLSDTILTVLLGTTTVNVLGLAYIVLKGLFKQS